MNEEHIQAFWNQHPCGEMQVGGLLGHRNDYDSFFTEYDKHRYRRAPHIPKCLDDIDFEAKEVLEIGLGQGADSEQIIQLGGNWSGLDLSQESVDRLRMRLALRNLPHRAVKKGSVLQMPFDDNSFDIVFSHGVLHHVPDIETAQREIHRVLKPDGELVVMLYAKWSLNYVLSISVARRIGLVMLYLTGRDPGGIYSGHIANAQTQGLWRYLRMKNFVHRNTDGPLNPYAKVYDVRTVKKDFPLFTVDRAYKRYMHAPPLPAARLPLQRQLGWHLWVHLSPKSAPPDGGNSRRTK